MKVKRVYIIGSTSSGKTTLGKTISSLLNIPCLDLDEVFWMPEWTERPSHEAVNEVQTFVDKNHGWVVCGNYRKVKDMLLDKANLIIWIQLPFYLNLYRLLIRCYKRIVHRELCCNGNYESFWQTFFTKDSIIYWLFTSYWRNRRNHGALMKEVLEKNEKSMIKVTNDKEIQRLIQSLET